MRILSVSLVTPRKLKELSGYTVAERKMFEKK